MGLTSKPEDVEKAFADKPKEKKGPWTPPPNGPYLWEIESTEKAVSRAGNDMRVMKMVIASGPHKGVAEKDYCALTEKAKWKLDMLAAVLGIKGTIDWEDNKVWAKQITAERIWADTVWEPVEYTVGQGPNKGEVRTAYRAKFRYLKEAPVPMESIVTDAEGPEWEE